MRSKDALIPHIALPFRFIAGGPGGVEVNEQDTLDDVYDCVQAIVRCPLGFRPELPGFGTSDQTFSQGDAIDIDMLEQQVSDWEPRADLAVSQAPALWDEMIDIVKLRVAKIGGPGA